MAAPLAYHLSGWARYNDLLERTVARLDPGQLALRASPDLWSVRTLANHIVDARAYWFSLWMGEGGEALARLNRFDEEEGAGTREGPAIADALGRSWSCLAECLGRWTEADLEARFPDPSPHPDDPEPWRTRQWIVWHVAEHDLHHGGEISLTLGMHGLPGLDL